MRKIRYILKHSLKIFLLVYDNGPSVKKDPGPCSSEYGTFEWAKGQCDDDVNCKWLHDWGCDDENWRYCSNVGIDDHIVIGGTDGCSKIKSGNKCIFTLTYFAVLLCKKIPYK